MPIPNLVKMEVMMPMLRLKQSVTRPSSSRFTGCFSLYLSIGHNAAQIEHTKINDILQN